jgi:hypothetical protein
LRAYEENRRAAIDDVIEADPVADHVRDMMAKATTRTGSASDLHRIGADRSPDGRSVWSSGWPKSPRALAGRLRRAQTSLRTLGIEIAFSREGRGGTRIIRMSASHAQKPRKTVNTVSTVSAPGQSKSGRHLRRAVVGKRADDADGDDAKSAQLDQIAKRPCANLRLGTPLNAYAQIRSETVRHRACDRRNAYGVYGVAANTGFVSRSAAGANAWEAGAIQMHGN